MQEGKSRRTRIQPSATWGFSNQPGPINISPGPKRGSGTPRPQASPPWWEPPASPQGQDSRTGRRRQQHTRGGKLGCVGNSPHYGNAWINAVRAPPPQFRDLRPLSPTGRGCLQKGGCSGTPLSPVTHCCGTRAGCSRLCQRWRVHGKEIAALWLKNPQESLFLPP